VGYSEGRLELLVANSDSLLMTLHDSSLLSLLRDLEKQVV
jgi:hypothetical protein